MYPTNEDNKTKLEVSDYKPKETDNNDNIPPILVPKYSPHTLYNKASGHSSE
jgi:hypothetical protein